VSFLYKTGWRWRSEAARLRWTNVAFDAGEVRLEPGTTKTGEGRVFPFTAELRALFERRRAVNARPRTRARTEPVAYVFTRLDAEPIRSFNKAWATACRAAACRAACSTTSADRRPEPRRARRSGARRDALVAGIPADARTATTSSTLERPGTPAARHAVRPTPC